MRALLRFPLCSRDRLPSALGSNEHLQLSLRLSLKFSIFALNIKLVGGSALIVEFCAGGAISRLEDK